MKELKNAPVDVSIIITAHSEGILIHRTLKSVRRAISKLGDKYSSEIILHVDNPTASTTEYIETHKMTNLKDISIYQNSFGDLGLSRNFAIQKAHGKYISTIDADDIMSGNWLMLALDYLEKQTEPTVAHSEVTVEFEGADSLIIKHGEIDLLTDTLLSVFANRWNSVIVAPRYLLINNPYTANSPGYGYEDWHLNCRLIAAGVHNILIPETAIFVRRKMANSEWLRQMQSMAVLRANPLLSFENVHKISNPFKSQTNASKNFSIQSKSIKTYTKEIIKRYPTTYKITKKIRTIIIKRPRITIQVPSWLKDEWLGLHKIDRQIFPSRQLMRQLAVYDTITEDHKTAGNLYKELVDALNYNQYSYIIFAPWLIKGGADQYTINYANTIAKLCPDKKVLVIATLPVKSVWTKKLDNVDFLDFGNITKDASPEIRYRLMGHIIENCQATHLHIINSEFGYDFVRLHEKYIKESGKKVIVTSFSQSIDKEGKLYGYSHTHVPFVYDIASYITSDNQALLDMWHDEYGFDNKKMVVHRQPINLPNKTPEYHVPHKPLRILWAARISPEKQPELLSSIGQLIQSSATIDVYGTIESGSENIIKNFPDNVIYQGSFDGFSSLPLDQYDVLLYTSLFDGMPNTILEAAQAGLPIIASAVGGIPEFIKDKETGLLITDIHNPRAYADAILLLINNQETTNKMSVNAYKKIRDDFTNTEYISNVKLMLEQLNY